MKKLLNLFYILLVIVIGLLVQADLALRYVLPLEKVQQTLQTQISSLAGRAVQAEKISVSLTGIHLQKVKIAHSTEESEQEDLFFADEMILRFAPWGLLSGHIDIRKIVLDGLQINVVREKDGRFNFDDLFASSKKQTQPVAQENKPFSLNLSLKNLYLDNSRFSFTDNMNGHKLEINPIYLSVTDFRFDKEFSVSINANIRYKHPDFTEQTLQIGTTFWPHLHQLDLAQASVFLKRFVLKHTGGVFVMNADVKNLKNPSVEVLVNAKNISSDLIAFARPQVSAFEVPKAKIYVSAQADLDAQQIQLSSFTISALDSFVSAAGKGSLGTTAQFDLAGQFKASLADWGKAVEMLQPYHLAGTIGGVVRGNNEDVSAQITLDKVGAVLPHAGTLSGLDTFIEIADLNHLNIEKFSGQLNEGPFDGSLSVQRSDEKINADLKFFSKRLDLPKPLGGGRKTTTATPTAKEEAKPWPLPPISLKTDIQIGALDAPFIAGKNIRFATDLQGITPALEQVHGKLSLHTANGEIKDLNQLTHANVLTKVLFGSLGVVSNVINSMNVFSLLDGIGKGMVSAVSDEGPTQEDRVVQTILDENGHEIQVWVPASSQKIDGRLLFEQFTTDIVFAQGIADVQRGSFVSDLMSFNLQGEMNFKTQDLDLQVNAAPGRHYEDGIMLLTLKIGGTMSEPKGSVSMMSSLTSVVTQGVGNNFVSRSVKKVWSGITGLFKKEKPQEEQKIEE